MASIIVRGCGPLQGTVSASGSKNAALPIIAACLLNDRPVHLHNVPALEDVRIMREVLSSLGARCSGPDEHGRMSIDCAAISRTDPPYELVNRMRASFVTLGPLLARFGHAEVPLPGGCQIGARPVGEHTAAMKALGAEITQEAGQIVARAERLQGAEVFLSIASVGATQNALMAAALAEGRSVIHNAAREPEVAEVCSFLAAMGVEIEGIGTSIITVHGQGGISRELEYSVIPDRIEAGTYLLAIAGSGGSGSVANIIPAHLEALTSKMREMGITVEEGRDSISVSGPPELLPTDIRTAAHPGFPTDLQPQFSVLLTIANGVSQVSETVFERRMGHFPELTRMGATVKTANGTAVIQGRPGCLSGVQVDAFDLRGAAAMVLAGLFAEGETVISGLDFIRRGYEHLPEKFASLGGSVRFSDEPAIGQSAQ
ncbi:UDP-N-acetylglucosamine 1-carboxyvinyltransferase [bacterium]|nr:UDP-N-acetylglucosamine 1-carboxyvinyltransferase [bacterium]